MTAAGTVYDRGYRPYDGPRGGRRAAVAALYRATLRRALGFRRPWRQKFLPWMLLGIVTVPAAVNVGVAYVTRDSPGRVLEIITYRRYVGVSSALLLFVALVAPDLMCPDRRQRVLSLIFARPLSGTDYVVAKLTAVGTLLVGFSLLPQVVLYVGNMLVNKAGAIDYLSHHAAVLWQVPAAVVLLALYYASLGLAISSLTSRRVVAGASILALLLISSSVAGILRTAAGASPATAALNLLAVPLYLRDLVFLGHLAPFFRLADYRYGGPLAVSVYLLVVGTSIGTLLWRYRWAEA